ncbi:hypothetical protein EI94DRAFT_1702820 [Lactarius quietus]|nr:hypothetical protein EI94DRAFT_1702820 [Lactarius quietus]
MSHVNVTSITPQFRKGYTASHTVSRLVALTVTPMPWNGPWAHFRMLRRDNGAQIQAMLTLDVGSLTGIHVNYAMHSSRPHSGSGCYHFFSYSPYSAGCVWNDILDQRTKHRPIADGRVSVLVFLAIHLVLLLALLRPLNPLTDIPPHETRDVLVAGLVRLGDQRDIPRGLKRNPCTTPPRIWYTSFWVVVALVVFAGSLVICLAVAEASNNQGILFILAIGGSHPPLQCNFEILT